MILIQVLVKQFRRKRNWDIGVNWDRNFSQGAGRTKVHVYLPYRGAISFYVYIVPLGLISIFLYVGCVQISCGRLPTRFLFKFPYKPMNAKKDKISNSLIRKSTCVTGKAIKITTYNILVWLL